MILRLRHGAVNVLTNSWTIASFDGADRIVITYLFSGEDNIPRCYRMQLALSLYLFSQLLQDSYDVKLFVDLTEYAVLDHQP